MNIFIYAKSLNSIKILSDFSHLLRSILYIQAQLSNSKFQIGHFAEKPNSINNNNIKTKRVNNIKYII